MQKEQIAMEGSPDMYTVKLRNPTVQSHTHTQLFIQYLVCEPDV